MAPVGEIKMHIIFSSEYMNGKHLSRNVRDDLKEFEMLGVDCSFGSVYYGESLRSR